GITPYILTRPQDGRSPTQLLLAAGRRIEPPVSSPKAPAHRAAAVALPEPVLDPPASCSTFQGLQGCPWGNFKVRGVAHSVILSLPSRTAPASCSLATAVAS